jgi:hypothetical protein
MSSQFISYKKKRQLNPVCHNIYGIKTRSQSVFDYGLFPENKKYRINRSKRFYTSAPIWLPPYHI